MTKAEIIKAIDDVIVSIDHNIDNTESAMVYLKLDIKKRAFEEVKNFIADNLDEPKTEKKGA